MESKEEKDKKDIYYELRQIMKHAENIAEILLPPKEVRGKFMEHIREAEVNILKAIKVVLDYRIEEISGKSKNKNKKRVERIKVE